MYRQPRPVPVITPGIGAHTVKRGLLIAKAYYFFFFGAIGCLVPFFNVYLKQTGLSGTQIGWLGSIAPLIALTANPFWGGVADRWQIHRWVLALCAFVSGVVTLLFLPLSGFGPLLVLVTALTFFRTPIGAIIDSAVMDLVKQSGNSYGRQRLWGTVSFVIATLGLGQWLVLADLSPIFWLHAALLGVGCVGLSFLMPVSSSQPAVNYREGFSVLVRQGNYVSFLIAMALMGIGLSSYSGFLGLHVLALGGSEKQVGLAWAANAVLEIPIMYFGATWFKRFSQRRLLIGAFFGYGLLWTMVSLSPNAAFLIAVVLGAGILYGTFWVAAVGYASQAAPLGLSATAQGLMGAAMTGVGWSLGSVMAGYLWDTVGGDGLFLAAAGAALLASMIFWRGSREAQ